MAKELRSWGGNRAGGQRRWPQVPPCVFGAARGSMRVPAPSGVPLAHRLLGRDPDGTLVEGGDDAPPAPLCVPSTPTPRPLESRPAPPFPQRSRAACHPGLSASRCQALSKPLLEG